MSKNLSFARFFGAQFIPLGAGLVIFSSTLSVHAAELQNPYQRPIPKPELKSPAPMPMPQVSSMPSPSLPTAEPVQGPSPAYLDNRTFFEQLDLIGRSDAYATVLQTSGAVTKILTLKAGSMLLVGGHALKVSLPQGKTSLELLEGSRVIWGIDMTNPRAIVQNLAPEAPFIPPMSAGVGVGAGAAAAGASGGTGGMQFQPLK
jgi:hypothetical protein